MPSKDLHLLFRETRKKSEHICSFLQTEDYVVQPIVDVSPPKWHLGHTTWFFEEFILKRHVKGYREFNEKYGYVFNSYYESVGAKVVRTNRGNLSRPTVTEVYDYRQYITSQMDSFFQQESKIPKDLLTVIELGIHHEKQHQELLMTDIKYILGTNPLFPPYNTSFEENPLQEFSRQWIPVKEGVYEIGHKDSDHFCFDNELAVHKVYIHEFHISSKLVTNREYLEFMEDGGYQQVLLWHSEGWEWKNDNQIKAPFYWIERNGQWYQYTLKGLTEIPLEAPVTHLSFYEAFAFAQWKGMSLPTEFQWEVAQPQLDHGSRWEWTESAYSPYPGYSKAPGALGEYNGKFMVSQKVLRGGSVASAPDHLRPTYRNFFHPPLRWQFTGLRLVK